MPGVIIDILESNDWNSQKNIMIPNEKNMFTLSQEIPTDIQYLMVNKAQS